MVSRTHSSVQCSFISLSLYVDMELFVRLLISQHCQLYNTLIILMLNEHAKYNVTRGGEFENNHRTGGKI